MGKDRNKTPDDENGAPTKKDRKYASESESESDSRSKKPERSRNRKKLKRGRSRSRTRSYEEDSYTSSSEWETEPDTYSERESRSSEDSSSESEDERRRRKRRERKKREKEKERRRRREKEKEQKRREKKKKEKRKEKKKDKEKDIKGAVTNSWGKYGIIRETDMWNKRPEFTAWLAEVKQVNLESLPNWEEKQMFKEFMEDHNTATFPSKKYYDLDAYHRRKMEKERKRGSKIVQLTERTVFNDEEQRRQEMMRERERQKEEQIEALKCSMQSGMAQAMKEQAQLREEMAYQYKIGNFEAAAAIQRRLDPDVAM